jgi:hypothetical protein
MARMTSVWTRQLVAAAIVPVLAVAAGVGAVGPAGAADLDVQPVRVVVHACPKEVVILFDERGYPTVPARTPYFYCVTGTTLLPGDIPPPREYCC